MHLKLLDGLGRERNFHLSDFAAIPSVGHRVKMGYEEAPKVTDVIWDFGSEDDLNRQINVTVFMNDANSLPKQCYGT